MTPTLQRTFAIPLYSLLVGMLLTACDRQPAPPATTLDGSVHADQPVQFDAPAELELKLEDVSGTDGAVDIATVRISNVRALPYQYSLPYEATRIDRQHRYTLSARVRVKGELRYVTDTAHPVLTQGYGSYGEVRVNAVGAAASVTPVTEAAEVFAHYLDTAEGRSDYRAGFSAGQLRWIEEERGLAKGKFHARYEYRGAYLQRYSNNAPLELLFDERGRPVGANRNGELLALDAQRDAISQARNRATLLRSHALAAKEARAHRVATAAD